MFIKNSKLDALLESLQNHYRMGCFIPGDIVTFSKGFTSDANFKKMAQEVQEIIKDVIEQVNAGDVVVKIIGMDGGTVNKQDTSTPVPQVIELGVDVGAGFYDPKFAIPGELVNQLERVQPDEGTLFSQNIPKNAKIDMNYNETIKLSDVKPKSNMLPGADITTPVSKNKKS